MSDPEKPYQAAHEIGRVYDSITDSKVLIDFFLMTLSRFVPVRQSYLFLATRNKTLLLEASVPILINRSEAEIGAVKTTSVENKQKVLAVPSGAEVPPGLVAEAQKTLEEGKLCVLKGRMFLPLIARNSIMGVACLERAVEVPAFTPQEIEIGFDLASEFSGALKTILLFEENVKMERLAAVGQAMGMVVHEIKNIMQLARFADEITRMGLKEKNEKFLATGLAKMTKTLKEMDGFIWEMLSLTKDYQLEPEEVDLAAILAELQSDLAERAEGYHIRLEFMADPGFPAVQGDGRSLYRALLNLVKNAFEAFQGKQDACVKIRARIKDEEHYELIVEDNASGMSEEVKAKLFETFFSTKGKRGTGLGLMVVQRTARMHQGAVHVESEPGMGTRFILTLRRSFPKTP